MISQVGRTLAAVRKPVEHLNVIATLDARTRRSERFRRHRRGSIAAGGCRASRHRANPKGIRRGPRCSPARDSPCWSDRRHQDVPRQSPRIHNQLPPWTPEGGERVKIPDRPARTSARGPDEALIRSLYTDHGRSLLAYAVRMTGDRHAAEDLVQDTIVKAWKNSDTLFNGTRSVRAWLLTVLRNLIIDRARAKAARPTEVAESPWYLPVQRDHADDVVDSMVILRALEGLPPRHREVLVELYYRGRTTRDAAAALGIPEGTVRSRAFKALRSLRGLVRSDDRAVEGVA
jgi:RNA polymerase sigma-70 factor, ECF subfamily